MVRTQEGNGQMDLSMAHETREMELGLGRMWTKSSGETSHKNAVILIVDHKSTDTSRALGLLCQSGAETVFFLTGNYYNPLCEQMAHGGRYKSYK